MRHVLLSFDAKTFQRLENNEIKFEYRKNLPSEEFTAYFYVSRPVMAISGIAHIGQREELSSWLVKYGNRSVAVRKRIEDFLADCRFVAPILSFQRTNRISLEQLRKKVKDFVVPRMYYYIEGTSLDSYLKENLKAKENAIMNTFVHIENDFICN